MKNLIKNSLHSVKEQFGTRSTRVGSYSFFLTVLVLAILVAVNVALSFLPDRYVQKDLTANQLYSLSSQSKVLLGTVEDEITIYWVVASGNEDEYVEKLLHNYEDYCDRITVVKKDPDLNPDFTNAYTDETIYNNSIIVECGDKYRYISYEDIYETSGYSYYSSYTSSSKFAGESLITSAISYCITEELPVIHVLEGHGETAFSDSFTSALERDNLSTETLSLLEYEEVPEEVQCILIYAPSTDLSETERDMLISYLDNGGRLLILSGTAQEDELSNLNAVAEHYGITVQEGVAVEQSSEHYVFGSPVLLMPEMNSSEITDPLISDKYNVILPVAKALDVSDASDDVTVTSLLESSEEAILKTAGYGITTYEKEDGDLDGPLTLAALVTKDLEEEKQMQLVWIASSEMLAEEYNSLSSDANEDFVLNALEMMSEKDDGISVRSKSLSYEYLTVSTSAASYIKLLTIGVIPAVYLITGIIVAVRRKRR